MDIFVALSGHIYQEHFFSHLKIGAGVGDVDPLMHDADDDGDDDDDTTADGDGDDGDGDIDPLMLRCHERKWPLEIKRLFSDFTVC